MAWCVASSHRPPLSLPVGHLPIDGECSQVIVHPAISVWAVSTMPNGDIISGSSDGVIRVFSESEERWATASELKALEDQISSQSLPSQQVGDVRKSDLPGPQALSLAGIVLNTHI